MKGVRTMFGRLFLSTGSDTSAGAKAKSFAPSPHLILYPIGWFKPSHTPSLRQKTTSFFCTGGSRVKKKRIFSAPQGCMSKNNGFFLRCRVACQKIMDFFCAAGLQVKKQWIFSAPQGCKSKNNGFFLRRRVASPKIMDFFCAAGLHVKKNKFFLHHRVISTRNKKFSLIRRLVGRLRQKRYGMATATRRSVRSPKPR